MKKIKISKKYLTKEYIKNRKSIAKIAEEYNCNVWTIYYRLKEYNIKIRTKSEAQKFHNILTRKFLTREYTKNKKSPYTIAKEIKSSPNNVRYYLKKYGIEIRNHSEAQNGKSNHQFGKRGKETSNYIEGLNRNYPLEFNRYLKRKIRKRDNYTCQNCEMIEEEHLIVYGNVLEVHHIDYNKENSNKENLITLCKQCNVRANYNRIYWQEHFEQKMLIFKKE